MYQFSASSAAESMNRANQSARARTAVDPVCSTTLLMAMSAERYQHKKEEAWNWEQLLTPYGMKLRDGVSMTSTTDIIGSPLKTPPQNGVAG